MIRSCLQLDTKSKRKLSGTIATGIALDDLHFEVNLGLYAFCLVIRHCDSFVIVDMPISKGGFVRDRCESMMKKKIITMK